MVFSDPTTEILAIGLNQIVRCIVEDNGVGIENPLGHVIGCSIVGNSESGIQWSLGGYGIPVDIKSCAITGNGIGIYHDDQDWVQHPLMRDNIIESRYLEDSAGRVDRAGGFC